jgi:basic membrane protein A
MSEADTVYIAARRSGLRAYNRMVALGRPGHLPYLDDLLMDVEIASRDALGQMDLPLKKVIGTYSSGRSSSFAENYMPLLGPDTEFAAKWRNVYNFQMGEGIQEAIKVYEFLNWFYVVEGNKRVSVLKYFDAGSVLADVTRLVPRYDETDANIRMYYEFLEFYRETRINRIWLTKPGSYKTLLGLLRGIEIPKAERDNPSKYFLDYCYTPFRNALYEVGGDKLPYTTGDIFLRYFSLFKLHKKMTEKGIRPRLRALCEELRASAGEEAGLVTAPEEVHEPSLISSIIGIAKPKTPVRIAFAYSGSREVSNWAKAHELGRLHLEEALKGEVHTSYVDNVAEDVLSAYTVFKRLIEEGNGIVFATSPAFANAALRASLEFPNAWIFVCSEQHPASRVHTYFGRIYEARFLTGIIAGALTRTNKIGYVGSYPVKGVVSGVNAFALGARLVNPQAKVLVTWAYQWDFTKVDENCGTRLVDAGCDIISHQNTFTGVGYEGEYGLYSMRCEHGCAPDEYIATPVWNWGVFYEMIVRQYLSGAMRNPAEARPTQFWWGLSSGIVDVMYAKRIVPLETHKLVSIFKNLMKEGAYNPFSGPIFDRDGAERIPADAAADAQQIINMDWFVDGIEGGTPPVPKGWKDPQMTAELLEL